MRFVGAVPHALKAGGRKRRCDYRLKAVWFKPGQARHTCKDVHALPRDLGVSYPVCLRRTDSSLRCTCAGGLCLGLYDSPREEGRVLISEVTLYSGTTLTRNRPPSQETAPQDLQGRKHLMAMFDLVRTGVPRS